jgi:hypothetical protein
MPNLQKLEARLAAFQQGFHPERRRDDVENEYLGDSVYVDFDEITGMIKLTTENGLPNDPSNTILLEPEVMAALLAWHQRLMQEPTP